MERILGILFFLTASAHAAVPSGNPAVNLGTYPSGAFSNKTVSTSNLSSQFTLVAGSASGTNTGHYRFVKMGQQTVSTEQYIVTTGKVAYCLPVGSLPSAINISFGYGSAPLTSEATVTPPTGVRYYAGSVTGLAVSTLTASVPMPWGIVVQFPSAQYPFLYGSAISASNFAVYLLCEEQ